MTTDIFPPDVGGPATFVPVLAAGLARRGHEVRVITWSRTAGVDGDGAYPFTLERLVHHPSRPRRLSRLLRRLAVHLARAEVVHVNGLLFPVHLLTRVIRRPAVAKVVGDLAWEWAQNHGRTTADIDAFQQRRHGPAVAWRRTLRGRALRGMNAVAVPSGYLARLVTGWGVPPSRVHVIPNAWAPPAALGLPSILRAVPGCPARDVPSAIPGSPATGVVSAAPDVLASDAVSGSRPTDMAPAVPGHDVGFARSDPSLALDRPGLHGLPAPGSTSWDHGLVTVCRLVRWKGVDTVIDAVAGLPGVPLMVIGDGPERRALEARAAERGCGDRVAFTGALSPEETFRRLRIASAFVLHSRYEGFPHAVLEAFAAGAPVIAAAAGGTPEVVRHEETGLLVPPGDVAALRDAVRQVLGDARLRTRLTAAARQAVESWPPPSMVEAHERLLAMARDGASAPEGHGAAS